MKLGNIQLKKGGGGGGGGQPQTPWASNINGANFTLSNAVLGTNIKATTISEAVAGGGVSFITSQGAFAWGGDNVSMSLADDTETFFMTANGGITFTSGAGLTYSGNNTSLIIDDVGETATIGAAKGLSVQSLLTGDPLNSAAEVKFGDIITAVVSLDAAHYWEVKVGNTVKKVLVGN